MVISKLMGGLGNQMFQYAVGRQLSLTLNTGLYLDTFELNTNKDTQRNVELDRFNTIYKKLSHNEINFGYTIPKLLKFYAKKWTKQFPYQIIQERSLRDMIAEQFHHYTGRRNFHPEMLDKIIKDIYIG